MRPRVERVYIVGGQWTEVETRSSCCNWGQWRNSKYVGHLALGSMWDVTVRREQGDQYLGIMCRGVQGKF